MTNQEMLNTIAKLTAENEALKKSKSGGRVSLKVSQKGAVSLYGLGRFPVTLYAEQWAKVFGMAEQVNAFIAANQTALATPESKAAHKAEIAAAAAAPAAAPVAA